MTISFVNHTETGVSAATTTVTHPTGITADDWLVLVANSKASSRVPTAPADWTNRGNISGGSGAAGVDTGITRLTYWSQLADGAETGTFDITWSASATNQVAEMVFRKTVAGAWVNAFVFGDDATQSTGSGAISVTPATDPGFTAGDMVVVTFGLTTDAGLLLNPAITVPGCTVGLVTERVNFRSTAGNDGGIWAVTASITAGTSTGPPTFTAETLELNASAGPGLFVRLREPAGGGGATPTPAVVPVIVDVPTPAVAAGSTVTPSAVPGSTALPTPLASAGATSTPAAIAVTSAVPTPTVVAHATATPAVIAATASFPALAVEQDWTADPAVIAVAAALPTPSIFAGGGATATPAVVALSATLPTPTVSIPATAAPAVIAVTTTVPVPTVGTFTHATANPAAITAVVSLTAVTLTAGSSVATSAITVSTTLPTPTVDDGVPADRTTYRRVATATARRTATGTARRSTVATARRS